MNYPKRSIWRILLPILGVLLLFGSLIWFSYSETVNEYVSIANVNSNSISIVDNDGNKVHLKTSLDFSKLIDVDQMYWVKYEKRRGVSPKLVSIYP